MVINTNISAQTGARQLVESSSLLSKSLARLSSGSKIVSPEDDAAGLAVSMRFDAQINRIQAANKNVGNAISFSQTQDGYLKKIGKALDRMGELSILAQDVTKSDSDRGLYNQEFQTLYSYINNVVSKDFNGVSLFNSSALNAVTDADGGTFAMAGVSGNYLAASSGLTGSTTLNAFTSKFTDNPDPYDLFSGDWADSVNAFKDFGSSSTIDDLVNYFNSDTGAIASASYDASTGQLSVSIAAASVIYDYSGALKDMGFSPTVPSATPNGFTPDVYGDANNTGAAATTFTVTLTAPSGGGSSSALDVNTTDSAAAALTTVKSAISQLATDRATVGANIARLQMTSDHLGTLKDNLSAANSRIKDVDVAEESTAFARYNILVQAGTAMLSQANSMPSSILRLIS